MNTDTDALQERIARILNDEGWTFEGVHEPGEYDECEDCRRVVAPIAARIAQGIAAEVQAAKTEALREAADGIDLGEIAEEWSQGPGNRDDMHWAAGNAASSVVITLHARATEYETGDQR